jgi:hypothetical protein
VILVDQDDVGEVPFADDQSPPELGVSPSDNIQVILNPAPVDTFPRYVFMLYDFKLRLVKPMKESSISLRIYNFEREFAGTTKCTIYVTNTLGIAC